MRILPRRRDPNARLYVNRRSSEPLRGKKPRDTCLPHRKFGGFNVSIRSALPERPYPLQWPEGWRRTSIAERRPAPYRAPIVDTRDLIIQELSVMVTGRTLGVVRCQLSSDMRTKQDGTFYANPDEPTDPGAAVWWIDHAGELCVIACDAWNTLQGNLRAIALNIRHLRAVQRTRASQIFGKMAQSFRMHALMSENPAPRKPPCIEVLGLERWPVSRDELNVHFRGLTKMRGHPDQGGDENRFRELSEAYAEATRLLVAG
jgi:hypothetical protein